MAGSMAQWAADILAAFGAPHTQNNINNLAAWNACEGGDSLARNNPFNTTLQAAGAQGAVNKDGVQRYDTYGHGLAATVATLRGAAYQGIVSALRADAPRPAFASAVGSSPWGTAGSCIAGSPASAGTAAPGNVTLAADTSQADATCAWSLGGQHIGLLFGHGPSLPSACVIRKTEVRAVIGALVLVGGALIALPGLVIMLVYAAKATGAAGTAVGAAEAVPGYGRVVRRASGAARKRAAPAAVRHTRVGKPLSQDEIRQANANRRRLERQRAAAAKPKPKPKPKPAGP